MRELSLLLTPTFFPTSITDFLNELRSIPCAAARAAKIDEFVWRLETELAKIDAFKHELPFCMILLRDVITFLKKESIQNIQIALRTTEPALQEFIPLGKCKDKAECSKTREKEPAADLAEKKDWMRSAKLWSHGVNLSSSSLPNMDHDPQIRNNTSERKNEGKVVLAFEDRSNKIRNAGGTEGFMPLKRLCTFPSSVKENKMELLMKNPMVEDKFGLISALTAAAAAAKASCKMSNLSFVYNPLSIEQQQISRKQRRCWNPELHGVFLKALDMLGGEKVATPKQILEVMKVDGLTNDEVKSHLQKYRIHNRRLQNGGGSSSSQGNDSLNMGNLWNPNYECGESSKAGNSQLRSPEGPLHLVLNSGVTTSANGGDSMEEDDVKTENHSLKKSPLSRNNNGQ